MDRVIPVYDAIGQRIEEGDIIIKIGKCGTQIWTEVRKVSGIVKTTHYGEVISGILTTKSRHLLKEPLYTICLKPGAREAALKCLEGES